MTVEKVMITNGLIVGAVINDNGAEKKARLSDLHKLLEKGKITEGAKLVQGQVVLDASVIKKPIMQQSFTFAQAVRDTDGNLVGMQLTEGKQIDVKTAWSLAADNRIKGLQAAYMKDIDSKIVMTV